jgi:hypothetical protein
LTRSTSLSSLHPTATVQLIPYICSIWKILHFYSSFSLNPSKSVFFHALTVSLLPKNHMLFIVSKQCACSRRVHIEGHMNSREATHRFRTSNNAKSNPEIKGRNSIFFRHDALRVSGHGLFTSTPHVFLLNIFINKTERSIHFY